MLTKSLVNMLTEKLVNMLAEALVNILAEPLVNMLTEALANMLAEALVNMLAKSLRNLLDESLVNMLAWLPVKMLTKSLLNMLFESLLNISPISQSSDKHISQDKHEIYLIRYAKYDESSTITLKYFFLRYSFSVVDLKTSNWVYDFVVPVWLLWRSVFLSISG